MGAGEMSFTDMMQVRSWVPAGPVSCTAGACILHACHRCHLWATAWLHARVAPGDLTHGVTPLSLSQAWILAGLGVRLQHSVLPCTWPMLAGSLPFGSCRAGSSLLEGLHLSSLVLVRGRQTNLLDLPWFSSLCRLLQCLISSCLRCRSSWPLSWAQWGLLRHKWPSQMWPGLEAPFRACLVSSTANLSSHSYKVCLVLLDGQLFAVSKCCSTMLYVCQQDHCCAEPFCSLYFASADLAVLYLREKLSRLPLQHTLSGHCSEGSPSGPCMSRALRCSALIVNMVDTQCIHVFWQGAYTVLPTPGVTIMLSILARWPGQRARCARHHRAPGSDLPLPHTPRGETMQVMCAALSLLSPHKH